MPTAHSTDTNGAWPAPGDLLASRYQVGEVIGRGGSSVIYRGKEVELGRDVALKVLDVRRGSRDEIELNRRRFYREARLMAQLNAASTVTMYDYGRTSDDLLFLVFEYVDGRTLEEKLKRGPLQPDRARSVLLQILESLREAHAIGALHRDIKPSNIMLYKRLGQPDGVKVLDFGIAKHLGESGDITHAGTVIGTPHYLAPERIRGEGATAASDIFSLGLVTYAMLVGQSPVGHLRGTEAIAALSSQRHELPAGLDCDKQLRVVVNRMLEPRADLRFQTVDDVLKALDVTLDPVTSDRTGQSIDNLVAFPLDFDPVGGTPVDELTGTTSIHAMTLTTVAMPVTPAVDDLQTTALYDVAHRPPSRPMALHPETGSGSDVIEVDDDDRTIRQQPRARKVSPVVWGIAALIVLACVMIGLLIAVVFGG